jgi:hypothetical protein
MSTQTIPPAEPGTTNEGIVVFTFGTPAPGETAPPYGEVWLTIDARWWSPEDAAFIPTETMAQLLPWLVKVEL